MQGVLDKGQGVELMPLYVEERLEGWMVQGVFDEGKGEEVMHVYLEERFEGWMVSRGSMMKGRE